ncbi:MAG: FHA domain-containing protein [Gemmatimonadales bacterium]
MARWRRRCGAVWSALVIAAAPAALAAQQPPAPAGTQQAQEKAALLRFCTQMDQSAEHTVQSIRDRTDCWKRMQVEGMGDSLVDARYRAALADYDAAMNADSLRRAAETVNQRLIAVQRAIQARDLGSARGNVDTILAMQPGNQRAIAFRDRIDGLDQARRARLVLLGIAGLVLVAAAGLAIASRRIAVRHHREVEAQRARSEHQKAVLEIVDGIGRGKIYTINGPIFRVGSAESDRPEEKNDLVLSDSGGFISRYHCAIVRKEGKFFLIDSSLNGTYLDDELLERGEHRVLEDGAEFSLAGMARFKFLLV